jgi:hypothetical protein
MPLKVRREENGSLTTDNSILSNTRRCENK